MAFIQTSPDKCEFALAWRCRAKSGVGDSFHREVECEFRCNELIGQMKKGEGEMHCELEGA